MREKYPLKVVSQLKGIHALINQTHHFLYVYIFINTLARAFILWPVNKYRRSLDRTYVHTYVCLPHGYR